MQICQSYGYSRQAYYKRLKMDEKHTIENPKIRQAINCIRARQPRVGGKKLHKHIAPLLAQDGIDIGRDRLFDLLREWQLLIRPKRNFKRTTDSKHWFRTYKNLIKNVKLTRPNQIYASDITYIKTLEGFCYLFLITDMYSRKIVGYHVSLSLELTGAIKALKMALKQRTELKPLVHHSDRGFQYCCHEHVNLLKKNNIQISMTEDNHVYENSLAERVNGILKGEFLNNYPLRSIDVAKKLIDETIAIYNKERLHMSLDYRTPYEVHYN